MNLNMSPPLPALNIADMNLAYPEPPCQGALSHLSPQGTDNVDVDLFQLSFDVGLAFVYDAALVVYGVGNGFHVRRVHAGAVAAEMIELQAGRDRPHQRLISQPVCGNSPATDMELAITAFLPPARPFPASILTDAHLGPEVGGQTGIAEGGDGKIGLHRKTPFGVMQPEVIGLAAASIIQEESA